MSGAALLLCLGSLGAVIVLATSMARTWLPGVRNGAIIWGGIVVVLTEVSSALAALTPAVLTAGWSIVMAVLLAGLWMRRRAQSDWLPAVTWSRLGLVERLGCTALAALVATLGVIAIVRAPNSFDALGYHMPRVLAWLQQGSVAHFPTHNVPQLFQPPFAEYVILQFQALSGGDRFANLVQWLTFVGIGAIAALVTRQLGAPARVQVLATLFSLTLPIAVIQSTTAMNDLVPALWILAFTSLVLELRAHGTSGVTVHRMGLLGVALGLALLSKGTAYVFALPVCLWLVLWAVRHLDVRRVAALAFVPLLALALNTPHFTRNLAVFESPLAPQGQQEKLVNEAMTPGLMVSNVVRNLALHAAVPAQLWRPLVIEPVTRFHELIGVNVDDPRTTYLDLPFAAAWPSFHELTAGNPLHVLLILLSAAAVFGLSKLRVQRLLTAYTFSVIVAFLLFTAVFVWQPYSTRLHLPGLVLSAPFVAIVVSRLPLRFMQGVGCLLLAATLPWLLFGNLTPVRGGESVFTMPRADQYFAIIGVERQQTPLEAVAREIDRSRCADIGLVTADQEKYQHAEYPLWVLLDAPYSGTRIQHTGVTNESAALERSAPYSEFEPCLIVALGEDAAAEFKDRAIIADFQVVLARPETAVTDR